MPATPFEHSKRTQLAELTHPHPTKDKTGLNDTPSSRQKKQANRQTGSQAYRQTNRFDR